MATHKTHMKNSFYTDANAFAEDTFGLLASSDELEMENNLALGLIRRIQKQDYEDVYMLAVKNSNDAPLLAALMTPPYNLVLSKGDKGAIPILIADILQRKLNILGVIAPADMVDAFISEWQKTTGQQAEQRLELAFYAVTDVHMPAKKVPGVFRQATDKDSIWLTDWRVRFAIDSNLNAHEQKKDPEGTARKIKEGLLYIWENNGVPVSITGYAPVTANGVRIGSVYTPPEERGKGYASACVAHLSQQLLDNGRKWCSLFADMANPVSNGIYKKVGYKERCIYQEYRFQS